MQGGLKSKLAVKKKLKKHSELMIDLLAKETVYGWTLTGRSLLKLGPTYACLLAAKRARPVGPTLHCHRGRTGAQDNDCLNGDGTSAPPAARFDIVLVFAQRAGSSVSYARNTSRDQ